MGDAAIFANTDSCTPARAEVAHEKVVAENAYASLYQSAYQDHLIDKSLGARVVDAADKKIEFDPKALVRAAKDLASGTWSAESRAYFKKVFDDANKDPKANADTIYATLQSLGVAINQQADKDGTATNINLANLRSPDGTNSSYWFLMNGPGIDMNKEAQEIMSGRGGPSSAKAGDFVAKPTPRHQVVA